MYDEREDRRWHRDRKAGWLVNQARRRMLEDDSVFNIAYPQELMEHQFDGSAS